MKLFMLNFLFYVPFLVVAQDAKVILNLSIVFLKSRAYSNMDLP